MPLDQRWVFFASQDLRMAELAFQERIWAQVCFHSQQCVEKLLKARLAAGAIPRTHKIADLIPLVGVGIEQEFCISLLLLDRFYIPSRYPDAIPGSLEDGLPNQDDAADSLQLARQLFILS